MNLDISREHLGLALLVVVCVFFVKGFYLDLFEETMLLREEAVALAQAEAGAEVDEMQIGLLKARLDRAEKLKERFRGGKTPLAIGQLPIIINETAKESAVKPVKIEQDLQEPDIWMITLEGSSESLSNCLHKLEILGLPIILQQAELFQTEDNTTQLLLWLKEVPR